MKVTENWVGVVEKLQYASFENKSSFSKSEDPMVYICSTTLSEVGRGMARFKQYHNVVFYLTKEQYDQVGENGAHSYIEKNDRIEIKAGAKWQSDFFEFKSYSAEKLKNIDKSKLQIDNQGKPYYSEKAFAYKVVCKDENSYEIASKWYDRYYCTIHQSRIKLPLADKDQFKAEKLDWFLEPVECDVIEQWEGQEVKLVAYADGVKFADRQMTVTTKRDPATETYYLLLNEVK